MKSSIKEALQIMMEAPWSSNPVEQQHGSMGMYHRMHKGADKHHLAVRSYIHSIRFLCTPAPIDRTIREAEQAVLKLRSKAPGRCSGMHMFVAEAFAETKSQLLPSGGSLCFEEGQAVMVRAHKEWSVLPLHKKAEYERDARERATSRTQLRDANLMLAEVDLAATTERLEREAAEEPLLHRLSQNKFTDAEWGEMAHRWTSDYLLRPVSITDAAAARLFDAVPLPSAAVRSAIDDLKPERHSPAPTAFARLVAPWRAMFEGNIFMVQSDSAVTEGYKMVFATQSPVRVYFQPVLVIDRVIPGDLDGKDFLERHRALLDVGPGASSGCLVSSASTNRCPSATSIRSGYLSI